jgi:DNA-binding HxlR family transcriptional regulator
MSAYILITRLARKLEGTIHMATANPDSPVTKTAEVISGKWTLLIIRNLAGGKKRFSELERSLSGISPRTLSQRLRALEDARVVSRQTFAEVPPRVEYTLTPTGHALLPLISSMEEYGEKYLADVAFAPEE